MSLVPAPTIILPSENQTREFDAKLLLACVLAGRGAKVVVGARHAIHNAIADFAPGIYVAKDFRKPSERILGIIAGLGHHIVAWDEEGLVQPVPQLYYQRRYTQKAMAHVKAVFAWGPQNQRLMQGAPNWPAIPVHETGNPRLDLLRPELRSFHAPAVQALVKAHGRFVLFDSNFASFNPAVTSVAPVMGATGVAPTPYIAGRRRLFERWQKLVPVLAQAIAPVRLVIRPHPAEAHALWHNIAAGQPNITVLHEGPALPWIIAAEAMVHSGCTTGLEAYFLGKPALSFRPEALVPLAQDLPDSLSLICASESELVQHVQQVLASGQGPALPPGTDAIAEDAAFARSGPLASQRIADVLLAGPAHGDSRQMKSVMQARFRQLEKRVTALNPKHKTSDAMNALRYPGESLAVVQDKAARLAALLGLAKTPKILENAKDIFTVQA